MTTSKTSSKKPKRAKILCKIAFKEFDDVMIIYVNDTWRWKVEKPEDIGPYKLIFLEETGHHMFFYEEADRGWTTDYSQNDPDEISIGQKIVEAKIALEMDKVLRSKDAHEKED